MKTKKDLAVVSCFFDFIDDKRTKENFEKFYSNLKEAGYPIFIGEILADEPNITPGKPTDRRPAQLGEIVKENYFALDVHTPFWCRENMINAIVEYFVPKEFSKIVWIDPNIIIEDKNWLELMEKQLEEKDLVQIGSEFVSLDEKSETVLKQLGGARAWLDDAGPPTEIRNDYNLGGGWGVKRTFFKKSGLFDLDFSGSGDALTFLSAISSLMQTDSEILEKYKKHNLETYYRLMHYNSSLLAQELKLGYINQEVKILYSGDHSTKKYNQAFDESSLSLLGHFDYSEHFVLDMDRFNALSTEHKPFYRTRPRADQACGYFSKFIAHLRYKNAKDKISAQKTIQEEKVALEESPLMEEAQTIESVEIPIHALKHLIKTWENSREEVLKTKTAYERALARESMIFEAFKKGMEDSIQD